MILNYPSKTSFIQLQRKFKCTFFCYNRPRLDVILTEGSEKQYLGSIIVPFKFSFDNRMEIYGYNRKLKYIIIGSCCQMGLIAKSLPFEKCQKAEFCIFDGLTNKKITKIKKVIT